jgi:di/tricarboxylate transporter
MSGALQEIIGIVVFIVFGAVIYWDAKRKVSYSVLMLFGIILFSFFGFFTIYEWKFVGF